MLHAAEKELRGRNTRTERRTFNERPSKLETVNGLFFQVIFCDFSNSLLGQFPALLVRDGHAGERRHAQSGDHGGRHDGIAQLRRNGRVSIKSLSMSHRIAFDIAVANRTAQSCRRIRPRIMIRRRCHASLRRRQRRADGQSHYRKDNCNRFQNSQSLHLQFVA